MKLLKLRLVNPTNPEADTIMHIDPKCIEMIMEASTIDRRQRPEIECIIYTRFGPWAVREKPGFVSQKIEEANI